MSAKPHDTILAEGRYLRLLRRDGWEYVERRAASGVVAVVAVTADKKMIVAEQYRVPVGARVVDLPAGLAGDAQGLTGESLAAAAARELQEETGYAAQTMHCLFCGPSSAGLTSELVTFFRAEGLRKVGPGGGEATEDISVWEIPLAEMNAWLKAKRATGVTIDPKILAGLYFAGCHSPAGG